MRAMTRGTSAPQRALEADIADYSFDRAVICDRARTADILLANNFHFENNCAVLAIDGYPETQFETVRAMLKRNPRLRVFALHDAKGKGCRLARTLANDPAWFAGQVDVVDVGLRPRHTRAFRGLLQPSVQPVTPGNGISSSDAAWLSAQTLELAAIRPEQVLKRMYKALNRKDSDGDGGAGGTGGSSSSDDSAGNAGYAGGGGASGGSGSSVSYDNTSFAHEASDGESDSDGFG